MLKVLKWFLLVLSLSVGAAHAAGQPYDQATFDALQKQGKPILVMIHADWCPVCRAQAPIVEKLLKEKDFRGITALRVDFDSQKPIVRKFRAVRQSTLIVFKGGKELARSLGDTSEPGIMALLMNTL